MYVWSLILFSSNFRLLHILLGFLKDTLIKPTIVLDAGIASEKNIQWLKDNSYPYIVVSRKKKKEIPPDVTTIAVKKDDKTKTVLVQAGLANNEEADELELYCLRTGRKDLNEQQIWDIYTMMTDIEDAFRCMKSELGLRPVYHQKEVRCDGHIFITLLAYHLLHTIRYKLRQKGVLFCWTTIRKQLSTQVRITTTMKRKDGKVIRIRKSSKVEPSHQSIYDALNLPYQPGRTLKIIS